MLRHAHGEVTAALDVHIVLPVLAEVAVEAGGIVHRDADAHVEGALGRGRRYFGCGRVFETGERDEVVQAVVHGERGVFEDIGHVGTVAHIKVTANKEIVERAAHSGIHVGIYLSENHGLPLALGVDQLKILARKVEVHADAREVAHIQRAVEHERVLAGGIKIISVENEAAILNLHGLLVGAQVEAVDI